MSRYSGIILLSLLSSIALSIKVNGQILNIEKVRLDSLSKEKPFKLKLEANFDFYNRSATEDERAEFTELGTDISAAYAPGDHFHMLIGEISYVENNDSKILNNGNLHVRNTFNYKKKVTPEAFVQGQYDEFRGLAKRYVAGVALRWLVFREKKFMLRLGAGPMYEYEQWRVPESDEMVEVDFFKLSSNLIIRWSIGTHVDFNTVFYYQIGYDESISSARNRISNNSNLNFKINDTFGFKTGLNFAYEDRPIVPITKFIYSFENGIFLNF